MSGATNEGRDFQEDLCLPAISRLNLRDAQRVAIALDAAILFGVLEYVDGNASLQNLDGLRGLYRDKVARLKGLP